MKNCKSILCVVLGFALACAVAATAGDAPKLTFTFTKANVPGAMQTGPSGINNAGVMVFSVNEGAAEQRVMKGLPQ